MIWKSYTLHYKDKIDTIKILKDKHTRLKTKTNSHKMGGIILDEENNINIRRKR